MHIYFGRALLAAALLTSIALGGCSSNDDDARAPFYNDSGSSSSSSGGPPVEGLGDVQVHFPPAVSTTDTDEIVVRGIVEDQTTIDGLFINNTAVTIADDGSWSATVPLSAGLNSLLLEQDSGGVRSTVTQLEVEQAPRMVSPRFVAHDSDNDRVLVLDGASRSIIAVDLADGARTPLSPAPGADNLLVNPRGMLVDTANNRLLVFQSQVTTVTDDEGDADDADSNIEIGDLPETDESAEDEAELPDQLPEVTVAPFIAIDLTTGEQSVFSHTPPEGIYLANSPQAMALENGFVYVSDIEAIYVDADGERVARDAEGAMLAVISGIITRMDLSTGQMQVISELGTPYTTDRAVGYCSLTTTADAANIYAVVDEDPPTIRGPRCINTVVGRIEKVSGARTRLSLDTSIPGSEEPLELGSPRSLTLDYANQHLFMLSGRRILAVDLADANQLRVHSATGTPEGSDYPLERVESLTFDPLNNVLYAADDAFDSLISIDANTGMRTWISGAGGDDPDHSTTFSNPSCVTLVPATQVAVVCDKRLATIFTYDLTTGTKSIAANAGEPQDSEQVPNILSPLSATQKGNENEFLLLDNWQAGSASGIPRVLELNAENELEVLYTFGNRFVRLSDLIYHAGRDAAYVGVGNAVVELIFTNDGITPRTFSGGNTPNREHAFQGLKSLAMDYENHRILALDSILNAVIAVDFNSGQRTPLTSMVVPEDGGPTLRTPQALVVDSANNRALVLDSTLDALVAVDLSSGMREIIFQTSAGEAKRLYNGKDLALHPFGYVLVVDDVRDELLAIDLTTDQVVTLAR